MTGTVTGTVHTVEVIIKVMFRFSATIVALCSLLKHEDKTIFLTHMYVLTSSAKCTTPFTPVLYNARGNKTMMLRRSLKGLSKGILSQGIKLNKRVRSEDPFY